MKLTVVIPTYNEADNLRAITTALWQLSIPDLDILIVDDDSPDGTGALADELSRAYAPRFRVLHRPAKSGLGTAYVQGFQLALQNGADWIAQMDADFSHSPDYLTRFLQELDAYDVVVGSRYVPGGKLDERWSFGRYLLSWWANSVYVRLILGLQVHDATAGFKLWRRSALEKIDLTQVRANGYVFQVEMAYLAEQRGLRILEYPIYFEDRRIGHSKMSVRIKWEAASHVWEIRSRYGRMRNRSALVAHPLETIKYK